MILIIHPDGVAILATENGERTVPFHDTAEAKNFFSDLGVDHDAWNFEASLRAEVVALSSTEEQRFLDAMGRLSAKGMLRK